MATKPQRDSAQVAKDKMNQRLDSGDRAAALFYAERLQNLGKLLRDRQAPAAAILETARAVGEFDAIASLARVARRRGYVRPAMTWPIQRSSATRRSSRAESAPAATSIDRRWTRVRPGGSVSSAS